MRLGVSFHIQGGARRGQQAITASQLAAALAAAGVGSGGVSQSVNRHSFEYSKVHSRLFNVPFHQEKSIDVCAWVHLLLNDFSRGTLDVCRMSSDLDHILCLQLDCECKLHFDG